MGLPLLLGLSPIVDDGAQVLILGNMPSVMSLAAQQYYANPRNGFWRITSEIFGFDAEVPYEARTAAMRARGVAVWDVLRSCRRQGSLDSAIEPDSMVANDFGQLFDAYPMSAESTGSVGTVVASCSEMPCWAWYLARALVLCFGQRAGLVGDIGRARQHHQRHPTDPRHPAARIGQHRIRRVTGKVRGLHQMNQSGAGAAARPERR